MSDPANPASPQDAAEASKPSSSNAEIEQRLDDAETVMSQAALDDLLNSTIGQGTKPAPQAKKAPEPADDLNDAMSQAALDELLGNAMGSSPKAKPRPAQEAQAAPFKLGDLQASPSSGPSHPLELLNDVELDMRIELGRTQMRLEDVLHLRGGSVVSLDKLAGDPVDIYVNGRLIAHGEVLVMNDNFCVRVTELVGASIQSVS